MICQVCNEESDSCSTYNFEHKWECAKCKCKRLGIYKHLTKEKLIEKLLLAHREMHCLHSTIKHQSAMLETNNKDMNKQRAILVQWWWYGNGTKCEGLVMDKTKAIIGNMVP